MCKKLVFCIVIVLLSSGLHAMNDRWDDEEWIVEDDNNSKIIPSPSIQKKTSTIATQTEDEELPKDPAVTLQNQYMQSLRLFLSTLCIGVEEESKKK